MGKLMKGGISYGGVTDIDITNENVVLTVTEEPENPHDGMTILYEGLDTEDFIAGRIYQYSETDNEWLALQTFDSIPNSAINELFD